MIHWLTVRRLDIGVNLALIGLAVLVMVEVYDLGPGWGPSGPRPGFFPFTIAAILGTAAAVALVQAWLREEGPQFFEYEEEVAELLKAGVPAALAIATVPFLGLYLTAGIYLMLFAWWHGRFRWYTALAAAFLCVAALYLILDWGFRISMPRSPFYGKYFLI